MNRILGVLLLASLLVAGCTKKEEPKPNVKVNVPGVDVNVGPDGASVKTPAGEVNVKK